MAGEPWPEWPFEKVIDFQEGPGILAKDFRDEGVPLVRLSGLERGSSVLKGCNYLDPVAVRKRWAHFGLQRGDVLLSTSASLGRIAVVGADAVGAIPYTGIIRMRPRDERLYAPFIRYLLEGPDFQQQAEVVGVGSVIRHFGPMHLRQMTVRLPPSREQRAIAHILGTLDDKIELNRRMNDTLEAVARALFRSWFVDFDPVRAKVEGREPELPKAVDGLFPDGLTDSEIGLIPRGWYVASVGELARRIAMGPFGSDIKTDNFVPIGVPVVRGSNLTDGFVEEAFAFVSEKKADQLRSANAFPGDIVITHRGTLGQVGLIPSPSRFPRYVVSQSQMLVSADLSRTTSRYLFEFLRSPAGQHALLANTSQTGVPAIARPTTSLRGIRLVAPPLELLSVFDELLAPFCRRADVSSGQSRVLSGLRDRLLPRLVSGAIRIPLRARHLADGSLGKDS